MRITDAILTIVVLMFGWSVMRAHRDPAFNFSMFDLIMENGRVSKVAVAFMASLAVTSWIVLRMTVDGKMDAGIFGAYGAMWVVPIVAKMLSPVPPPATTTTITATSIMATETTPTAK